MVARAARFDADLERVLAADGGEVVDELLLLDGILAALLVLLPSALVPEGENCGKALGGTPVSPSFDG